MNTGEMVMTLKPGQKAYPIGHEDDWVLLDRMNGAFMWASNGEIFVLNSTSIKYDWIIDDGKQYSIVDILQTGDAGEKYREVNRAGLKLYIDADMNIRWLGSTLIVALTAEVRHMKFIRMYE